MTYVVPFEIKEEEEEEEEEKKNLNRPCLEHSTELIFNQR